MGMNIVGNVNGSYKANQIDLFEIAKKRGIEQGPIKTVSSLLGEDIALKVNISEEGLKALHGSKINGSTDLNSQIKQVEYMSEHQPVESFSNRLSRTLQESYEGLSYDKRPSVEEKGKTVFNAFKEMTDEIISGYENGTRVRFVEDENSEDGYRRLTMEDELSILQDEYDEFVENRFGKEHTEQSVKVTNAINEFEKFKESLGKGPARTYEPEIIPDNFVEKLKNDSRSYVATKTAQPNGEYVMTAANTNEIEFEHYTKMMDITRMVDEDIRNKEGRDVNLDDIMKTIMDSYETLYNDIIKAHENGDREVEYSITGKQSITLEQDLDGLNKAFNKRLSNLEGYITVKQTNKQFEGSARESFEYYKRVKGIQSENQNDANQIQLYNTNYFNTDYQETVRNIMQKARESFLDNFALNGYKQGTAADILNGIKNSNTSFIEGTKLLFS